MAKEIYKYGVVYSVVTDGINGKTAFPDGKAKAYYLKLLERLVGDRPEIKVLAYAVVDNSAYCLVYASNEKQINDFFRELNENYNAYYNRQYGDNGYIFRLPNQMTKIKFDDITAVLAGIHKIPEFQGLVRSYKRYRYSSALPIFKGFGIVDKAFLLGLLEIPTLDGVTYTAWHRRDIGGKALKSRSGAEKFNKAIDAVTLRYRGNSPFVDENIIKQIAIDVAERTGCPYSKLERKLGIKNRRDILIEIIMSMVFDKGYTFLEAVSSLQVEEYGIYSLLMEVIVTVNMNNKFGYDYIINKLQVEDSSYFVLAEVIKSLNRSYGMGFVEIAQNFGLQNDILQLRSMTGL
jgi:hypothetical protein